MRNIKHKIMQYKIIRNTSRTLFNTKIKIHELLTNKIMRYKKVTLVFHNSGDRYYIRIDGIGSQNVRVLKNGKRMRRITKLNCKIDVSALNELTYTIVANNEN